MDLADIIELQAKDNEVQELLKRKQAKGFKVFQNNERSVLRKNIQDDTLVLVIPMCTQKELGILSPGYFGKDKTLSRLSSVGWSLAWHKT